MRPPDLKNDIIGAAAWRITTPGLATIDGWLVKGPFHPAWDHWLVAVCHLRDQEGIPPAKKENPLMAYEFVIASLNPNFTHDPDDFKFRFLSPLDVTKQFGGVTDAQAKEICEYAVRAIVLHGVSPDQDFRTWWNRAIENTVEHILTGGHCNDPTHSHAKH